MPNAYYTCNLLPLELVARAGFSPCWLGEHLQDPGTPARRDALSIHPMTCPYVTSLVAAADALFDEVSEGDVLLVPGGCDAMRRLGDLLSATYPGRVFVLPLPRSSGDAETRGFATDLARLETWLREKAEESRRAAGAAGAAAPVEPVKQTPRVEYPSPPRAGGVFVVAGPLTDDSLLRLIEQLGAAVSGLDSCTSPDRWKLLATAGAGPALRPGDPGTDADLDFDYYLALADELLSVGMCPRRSTSQRRDYLARRLDESRPASIIYARQSFCDPGAYDAVLVGRLAGERGLRYLEIEVGFPFDAGGPLRTRVEAFLEAQLLDDDLLDDLIAIDDLEPGDLAEALGEEE
jgi:hypothetical protein